MTAYNKTTNFTAKDSLASGNPQKIVRGSEIDTEFTNIQTAVNSKANTASPTFTGTTTVSTLAVSVDASVGGNMTVTGTLDAASVDGGSF
jgi:hypothetical protein